MTMLVTTIAEGRIEAMYDRAAQAFARGSDMVELRLDALRHGEESGIHQFSKLPPGQWIATCRPVSEGGMSRTTIEHQVPLLLSAIKAGAGFIDFEYAQWTASPMARTDLVRGLSDHSVMDQAPGLILSYHDFDGRPANLEDLVGDISGVPDAIGIKIAWKAKDICCNLKAFDLQRGSPADAAIICMGEAGLLSRVFAGKFGALAGYCAFDEESVVAPGQLTLSEMRDRYRWSDIDEATEMYGVIGCPVKHSVGPDVFNDAFRTANMNAVYLPLLVGETYEEFAAFVDGCLAREWMDARGFSVTLPHKVHALRYLGDRVDPPADLIGAVNTIRIEDGEAWGCNTDCDAALDTLLEAMGVQAEDLQDLPVDVLGAGGVSRAVVAGLVDCGCVVTVYNRSADRARELSELFECSVRPWEERTDASGKVLINCTSVGMWPDVEQSPMPAESLRSDTVVFDTVYRPQETRLLAEAGNCGCTTVGGLGMFIRQAARQFEYWTHRPADHARISEVIASAWE